MNFNINTEINTNLINQTTGATLATAEFLRGLNINPEEFFGDNPEPLQAERLYQHYLFGNLCAGDAENIENRVIPFFIRMGKTEADAYRAIDALTEKYRKAGKEASYKRLLEKVLAEKGHIPVDGYDHLVWTKV